MELRSSKVSRRFIRHLGVFVPGAVGLHLVLLYATDFGPDVDSISAFVTAVGTLYSVLAAFTVVSVWTQFTDTDRAIKREARDLSELWRYVGYVSDDAGVARARLAIESYRYQVVQQEWPAMAQRETDKRPPAEDGFLAMADAVNAIEVTTMRDVPAWAEAVRTLGSVSDGRGERLILVNVRMPGLLRGLLYLTTLSLVGGMLLLAFDSAVIGAIVVTFTVANSLFVLEVIDDLDDPIGGAWRISHGPFDRIQFDDRSTAELR